MYDIIGDIHGHADALERLLERLGYQKRHGTYRHLDRVALFCGDLIDRGPRISDTLTIVRRMCENGAAMAVLGNHELNALAFHTPHPERPGAYLRDHSDRALLQHRETLRQLSPAELNQSLSWFRTLPVFLDPGPLRVVHACWDSADLLTIQQSAAECGYMTTDFLRKATTVNEQLFRSIERVLKGPEIRLPDGVSITDKEGSQRRFARIRWFESPDSHSLASYVLPSVVDVSLSTLLVPSAVRPAIYAANLPPVFFGHYWLFDSVPVPLGPNVACMDYGVAKNGQLAAYRFHNETTLRAEHFVTVPAAV
jgi:hypothetical protein